MTELLSTGAAGQPTLLEWLDSLPPGPRSADTWEEVERQFQEERNSWERPWYDDPPRDTPASN